LGQSAILTASGGGNYLWNNGNTSSTITVIPISTSNYSVTVSIGSCTDTASTSVIVNPSPTVTAGGEATISAGSSVTLTAAGGGPYSWNNGDTSASISVSPPGTTVYYVTTTNAYGCTDIDSVVVYVLDPGCGHPENDLFIPNAFSPNGDGENDSVKIEYRQRAACIRSFYFSVFNRWGQKVFETETISDYWDGRSKGGYLFESAVFTYYCKLTTISDETTVKRGNISLLK
jgi:gliding motility-associated-like protein